MAVTYGQLFVEAAPLLTKNETSNTYDWVSSKISFKINPPCLDSLLLSLSKKHLTRKEQNGKMLTFACPFDEKDFGLISTEDEFGGTLVLSDDKKSLSYLFSKHEILGLEVLLKKAKERIYGW